MSWLQRYRVRHYCVNSIWLLPSLGMAAALIAVPLLYEAERAMGWKSATDPEAARALLGTLAAYSCVACLAVFLYLIDHVGKALRPSGALRATALFAREVIENVYPRQLSEVAGLPADSSCVLRGEPVLTVANRKDGVVLAFDVQGLVYRTPGWGDFVQLAVTEIRHFGVESIQVARRLRAMLEDLTGTLPEVRAPLLRRELDLLHRSAERFFVEPEDRALAEVGDLQGVGSKCVQEPDNKELLAAKTK